MEEYHNVVPNNTPKARRYRGVSYTTPIDAAKEAVPVIDLADSLCGPGGMRRIGQKWVARCPLPGHEERTPSFTVYPGDGGWYCYGCHRGGDVVELARLAWGYYPTEAHIAAGFLLLEFGHEVPERPPPWFDKLNRQKPARDLIYETRLEVMTRRLWRYVFEPIVADIDDPEEREQVGRVLWKKVRERAVYLLHEQEARKA